MIRTPYLDAVLDPNELRTTVDGLIRRIRAQGDVDAVVFTGVSGAMVAPVVALRLGVYPVVVRKGRGTSHSGMQVEGLTGHYRYVIIDTGSTVKRILRIMRAHRPDAECVGVHLWKTLSEGGRTKITKLGLPAFGPRQSR